MYTFFVITTVLCQYHNEKKSHRLGAPLKGSKAAYNRATGGEASSFYSRSNEWIRPELFFCWLWGTEQDISLLYFKTLSTTPRIFELSFITILMFCILGDVLRFGKKKVFGFCYISHWQSLNFFWGCFHWLLPR